MQIAERVKEENEQEVHMLFGGFHLHKHSEDEVDRVIMELKDLQIEFCGPTHCTGEMPVQKFKTAFGEQYLSLGTGKEIEIQ